MTAKGCVPLSTGEEFRVCCSWLRSEGHGQSVRLWAGTDLDRRQGAEDATILLDRPPPELPSWSAREFRVWKQYFNFIVCLLFIFHYQTVYFFVGYFYCCKTLALGFGDGRFALTVVGSFMPNIGST
ncbi:unnamed protein product, partial [Cuscuta epithymum]